MELDMDYVDQEEDDEDGPEIEMNWNLAKYLPESGACQKNFNTVVAGKKKPENDLFTISCWLKEI